MRNGKKGLRWLEQWTNRLTSARSIKDVRGVHSWLWSTWRRDGASVADDLNASLGLTGKDRMQPDMPHLFAGQVESAQLLFVNINPGWNEQQNRLENAIVARSEQDAWSFSRAVFTRYKEEIGLNRWWSQAIGIARCILRSSAPKRVSAQEKRAWANTHIAGWELFPIHSQSAGFLHGAGKDAESPLAHAVEASLALATTFPAKITIVASAAGANRLNNLARQRRWHALEPPKRGLPTGTTAYAVGQRLFLSVPRPLVSRFSGVKFNDIASGIHALQAQLLQGRAK